MERNFAEANSSIIMSHEKLWRTQTIIHNLADEVKSFSRLHVALFISLVFPQFGSFFCVQHDSPVADKSLDACFVREKKKRCDMKKKNRPKYGHNMMRLVLTPIKARKKRMNNRKQNWFGLKQTKPPTKTAFDECIMNRAINSQRLYAKNEDFFFRLLFVLFDLLIRVAKTHTYYTRARTYSGAHRRNTRFVQPSNISIRKETLLIDNIH